MAQFGTTSSRSSVALRAAANASSYSPKPLHSTAWAYSQMAIPIPSPREPASRIVTSMSSVASRAWPRHAARINPPYGAPLIPVASETDCASATNEAAAESSPQNTSTGVRELNATHSSLSAPVLRAISR